MSSLRLFNGSEMDQTEMRYSEFRDLIRLHCDNPDVFIEYHVDGVEKSTLTFQDFCKLALGCSKELKQSFQLDNSSKIAVVLENSPEALIWYSAVMLLGYPLIPLDPNQDRSYYQEVSSKLKCDAVVANTGHVSLNVFRQTVKSRPLEELSTASALELPPSLKQEQPLVIFSSSGTTGRSKGIAQNFHALLANSIATIKAHSIDPNTRHFCILPVFHVNAFSFSFLTSLVAGNTVILNYRFFLPRFWETVNKTRPHIVSAIPPIIRLLEEDPRKTEIPKSLKYFVTAATHLGKQTQLRFIQRFGIRIIQAYGLSETVNFSTTVPTDLSEKQYSELIAADERTTIGTAVWGNNVFVLDSKDRPIDSDNTEGEIAIRGWNVMQGYFESPTETENSFRSGYFHTGDLGYFRTFQGQRYYYLSGRIKEIAKVNGVLFHLNQIDEAILTTGAAKDVCAVCFLDKNDEEQVGLLVVPQTQFELSAFKRQLKTVLPKGLSIQKVILADSIPTTPSGKKKRDLVAKTVFQTGKG